MIKKSTTNTNLANGLAQAVLFKKKQQIIRKFNKDKQRHHLSISLDIDKHIARETRNITQTLLLGMNTRQSPKSSETMCTRLRLASSL